ncbi:sirohydrochlorin chelatase [Paenibacillus sp.]|uniref:sirohydrochlorin chelatase n=1 Tax=Paenibacillus sp. TaxID=58172 RepID=UPI002D4910BF|nr:CbiX/SirB N-terminal domain-containing protein [Paenibacillus sp.]HZG56682.1 CbiX/SirB N-terminal domain-containing protein [Paenibacillus sp.]
MIGILVISHGSRNADWVRLVDEAIEPMRAAVPYPVYGAYLELVEGRLIQDGIDALEVSGVDELIVLPLFVSSGSTHLEEISWALGATPTCRFETDLEPFRVRARVSLCAPIDADEDVIRILYEKMLPLSRSPAEELVLVVGHGSAQKGFHRAWRDTLETAAERLRALGGFAAADGVMLLPNQVDGKLKLWRKRRPNLAVVVAPLFISEGYFTEKVIPSRFRGYDVRYNGRSLLPHPLLSQWMTRRIEEKVKELSTNDQESETHL